MPKCLTPEKSHSQKMEYFYHTKEFGGSHHRSFFRTDTSTTLNPDNKFKTKPKMSMTVKFSGISITLLITIYRLYGLICCITINIPLNSLLKKVSGYFTLRLKKLNRFAWLSYW